MENMESELAIFYSQVKLAEVGLSGLRLGCWPRECRGDS